MPFLSTFRVENVHVEVGGGQKRTKLCPRVIECPLSANIFRVPKYIFFLKITIVLLVCSADQKSNSNEYTQGGIQ